MFDVREGLVLILVDRYSHNIIQDVDDGRLELRVRGTRLRKERFQFRGCRSELLRDTIAAVYQMCQRLEIPSTFDVNVDDVGNAVFAAHVT